MADQLNSFVKKFYSLWQAGNDACLNFKCHAGQAQIYLQLNVKIYINAIVSNDASIGSSKFLCLSPIIRGELWGVDTNFFEIRSPGAKI